MSKRVADGAERRLVLDDVSFTIARGELAILRGPSGSGKTTLLAIVGAMLSPTSGEVLLDGEKTSRLRDAHRAELRRKKVGFVFQDLQLLDDLSAKDNVLVAAVPEGLDRHAEARATELLARFGLTGPALRAKAGSLSGGERQRVALARALYNDPPLLLFDEPTAHLDDAHAKTVVDELARFASEDRAVICATHDARVRANAPQSRLLDLVAGRLVTPPSEESA